MTRRKRQSSVKVTVGKDKKTCYVKYKLPKVEYRAFLNSDKSMMASVAVSGEEFRINDCYKIASLDFAPTYYVHTLKTPSDVRKSRQKVAKDAKRLRDKLNTLRVAIDVMEECIDTREVQVLKCIDEAEKQLPKYEKVLVEEKYD